MSFDLPAIQAALREFNLDGWLLYDFRGLNVLARRVLDIPADAHTSRRLAYAIPREGAPRKLVHRIESGVLDHLPGEKSVYLRWQEFKAGMAAMLGAAIDEAGIREAAALASSRGLATRRCEALLMESGEAGAWAIACDRA